MDSPRETYPKDRPDRIRDEEADICSHGVITEAGLPPTGLFSATYAMRTLASTRNPVFLIFQLGSVFIVGGSQASQLNWVKQNPAIPGATGFSRTSKKGPTRLSVQFKGDQVSSICEQADISGHRIDTLVWPSKTRKVGGVFKQLSAQAGGFRTGKNAYTWCHCREMLLLQVLSS